MQRKNYFEILPLEFDPAESNGKKIQKEIEEWKKRMQDLLGNESSSSRRKQIEDELALYEDMKLVLSAPKTRNPEAKAYREEKIRQLETLIEIMTEGQTGSAEVTNGQIRNVATKLRLQPGTVKQVYETKGFVVQKANAGNILANAFMKENVFRIIAGHITSLQKIQEAKYPWLSKTKNLYDLACFFCGGSEEDCPAYHRKRTSELLTAMQKGSVQYASDMSTSGHALADLFADGMTQVFDSEENRKKYDQSLKKGEMEPFFRQLKQAPEEFKRDRQFVESCIRTIQRQFSDYNMALALYNQEAGLMSDPFEPLEALIHVTCVSCGAPTEFRTRQEAERGKCPACGASLYINCPKCKKLVPANADRCTCGFTVSEMQFFEDYKAAALFALKNMDLTEAEHQLENANQAHPGHPDLKGLEEKVQAEVKRFKAPLEELERYMNAGLYSQAQKFLEKVSVTMPKLRLEVQRKAILEKMNTVKKLMPPSSDISCEAGNKCVAILQNVRDYQPAIDMLRMIRPRRPVGFHVAAVCGSRLKYMLSWNMAGDHGVAYQVVRKKDGVPVSHSDGEILKDNLNVLEYEDTDVQSGVRYGYAVFAERKGVYSDPAVCEVVNYAELDESRLQVNTEDGAVRFSWVLPENALGVRILRCSESLPPKQPGAGCTVITDKAHGNVTDTNVTNLRTYGYRLQCVYAYGTSLKYSSGITKMVTPQPKPVAVKNIVFRTDRTLVSVTWVSPDAVSREAEIREAGTGSARDLIGQVLPVSQINAVLGNGKVYSRVSTTDGSCQFQIPGNSSSLLAVVVTAGSNGIISAIQQVSSVEKCEIDKKNTRVEGNRLKIKLKQLPKHLDKIHYQMTRKVDQTVPWAQVADAKAGRMIILPQEDYVKNGLIVINHVPEEDLYVTVIGEFRMPNGQTVYSEPSKHRIVNTPKKKIVYRIEWGTVGFFRQRPVAEDAKLVIECTAIEIPELKLVYRTDGHIPMSVSEPLTIDICTVPETESGYPEGRKRIDLPNTVWSTIGRGSQLRLMLADEDNMAEYELEAAELELLKVP